MSLLTALVPTGDWSGPGRAGRSIRSRCSTGASPRATSTRRSTAAAARRSGERGEERVRPARALERQG